MGLLEEWRLRAFIVIFTVCFHLYVFKTIKSRKFLKVTVDKLCVKSPSFMSSKVLVWN